MRETLNDKRVSDIFQELLTKIGENTNQKLFDTMFSHDSFELKSLDNNKAVFVADSASNATIIKSAYLSLIRQSLEEITQNHYDVEITDKSSYLKKKAAVEGATTSFFHNSRLLPQYTFDNFVTGPSNKDAFLACLFAVQMPATNNPVFLYSKSGLGKTHLLQATGNDYRIKHPESKVLYITSEDFLSEFVRFIKGRKDSENLKDFFNTVDLLLVDDIQFLAGKEDTQIMFFNVFNLLVSQGKQIILTSDRSPSELKGLQDRLVSRFSGGLSINIGNPNKDTLIAILKKKMQANSLPEDYFEDKVLDYLAMNYSKNVRELEGAFTRLLFAITVDKPKGNITLPFCKKVFDDDEERRAKKGKVDIDRIIAVVADYYSLTEAQIKSNVRTSQIALARQIAMYLSRQILNLTYQVIGRTFSKDHTTVLFNVQKIEKALQSDNSLRKIVDKLTETIKSGE